METQQWSNFVECLISKKSYELACAFSLRFKVTHDVLNVLKYGSWNFKGHY